AGGAGRRWARARAPAGRDGARHDGPQRLHRAPRPQPVAGRGRPGQPARGGDRPRPRGRLPAGRAGDPGDRRRLQQGHAVAEHAGHQRTQ
ncbi:hypothetical protein COK69_26885, partial [Bacillus cereus]